LTGELSVADIPRFAAVSDDDNILEGGNLPSGFPTSGDEVVLYIDIENIGDSTVTDFDVTFSVLGEDFDSTVRVQSSNSDLAQSIPAGETLRVYSWSKQDDQGELWTAVSGDHGLRAHVDSSQDLGDERPNRAVHENSLNVSENRDTEGEPALRGPDQDAQVPDPDFPYVMFLRENEPSAEFKRKAFVYHVYDDIDMENPVEVTNQPSQDLGVESRINQSPDSFRVTLRLAGQIEVPPVPSPDAGAPTNQNTTLKKQVNEAESLEGSTVEVIASKLDLNLRRGVVQNVHVRDETESDNVATAEVTVKEVLTPEDGGVELGVFRVPAFGEDTAQDNPLEDFHEDKVPPFGPGSIGLPVPPDSRVQDGGITICERRSGDGISLSLPNLDAPNIKQDWSKLINHPAGAFFGVDTALGEVGNEIVKSPPEKDDFKSANDPQSKLQKYERLGYEVGEKSTPTVRSKVNGGLYVPLSEVPGYLQDDVLDLHFDDGNGFNLIREDESVVLYNDNPDTVINEAGGVTEPPFFENVYANLEQVAQHIDDLEKTDFKC
jgi:hypothetical protein